MSTRQFVVYTDEEVFEFEGKIGGNEKQTAFVSKGKTVRVVATEKILAIMREDFAEQYRETLERLERLEHGDPENN